MSGLKDSADEYRPVQNGRDNFVNQTGVITMADSPNGKPATKQELQRPLKEARRSMYEAGIKAFHETAQEVEDLKNEIDRQRQDLMARDMEIKSLHERSDQMMDAHAAATAAIESRAAVCQADRDKAVSETVALKTILASMKRIWDLSRLDDVVPSEESHDG